LPLTLLRSPTGLKPESSPRMPRKPAPESKKRPKAENDYAARKRAGRTAVMLWLAPEEIQQIQGLSAAWAVSQRDAIVRAVAACLVDARGGRWKCMVCGQYNRDGRCEVCKAIRESRKTQESKKG
jgi:hypothetical protein